MPKSNRYEVILAGSGGQGQVLAGIVLAEAAILEGKNVVQTQSYGVASRGGLSLAEVIIDEEEIIFQQVQNPTLVLALSEEAMKKFEHLAGRGVPLFYDTTLVKERSGENLYGYPLTQTASDLGNVGVCNILSLGVLTRRSGVVKMESLVQVIRKRFKGPAADLNLKALQTGSDMAAG